MKLTVIGAGSSYTPELLDGLFSRLDRLPVSQVCLMDVDAGRLALNAAFARRMADHHGNPFQVVDTTSLEEAVTGARYVVTQIRVGQMAARIGDEKLGLRHGIVGQETTGVGGFACALRTIPRILDVAHAMERLALDGMLINFTNPAGIVTEAVLKHSQIPTVGLCNVPIGMIMDTAKFLNVAPEAVELDYLGLNHLSWVTAFRAEGKDCTQAALAAFFDHAADEWEHEPTRRCMIAAMGRLGMLCNPYLQYYYATDTVLETLRAKDRTRGEEVLEVERKLFAQYADPQRHGKPEELSERGGAHYSTAAFALLEAIENDTGSRQIVCCRNAGALPTLDDDAAVEVPARIDRTGARPIGQAAPPHAVRGLLHLLKAYESLTVAAAVTGDRNLAYEALLSHPLAPNAVGCEALLDDVLTVNRPWLADTFYGA